jgi:hypothetical protein
MLGASPKGENHPGVSADFARTLLTRMLALGARNDAAASQLSLSQSN